MANILFLRFQKTISKECVILKKMKIYTKTGDKGETSLVEGTRVKKYHPRIEAYGTLDELNSHIGLALAHMDHDKYCSIKEWLRDVQHHIFNFGSHLACDNENTRQQLPNLNNEQVAFLETTIDHCQKQLTPLKNFILPGGSISASSLHVARTIARRAERLCLQLHEDSPVDPIILRYLNRLSDFLFVLARYCNFINQQEDILWKK